MPWSSGCSGREQESTVHTPPAAHKNWGGFSHDRNKETREPHWLGTERGQRCSLSLHFFKHSIGTQRNSLLSFSLKCKTTNGDTKLCLWTFKTGIYNKTNSSEHSKRMLCMNRKKKNSFLVNSLKHTGWDQDYGCQNLSTAFRILCVPLHIFPCITANPNNILNDRRPDQDLQKSKSALCHDHK